MYDEKLDNLIDAIEQSNQSTTPEEAPSFSASLPELLAALISCLAAWVYTYFYTAGTVTASKAYLFIFALIFTLGGLVYYKSRLKKKEHWIWLGCLWVMLFSILLNRDQVWGKWIFLFLHAYGIYWVLSLSGKQMTGISSGYLLTDALHGTIVYPLKSLFLCWRLRCFLFFLRKKITKKRAKDPGMIYAAFAAAIAGVIFFAAWQLLMQADENFAAQLSCFRLRFNTQQLHLYFLRFLISLPIGAYLFGLVVGTDREPMEHLETGRGEITDLLQSIRKVPASAWTVLTGAFVVFYLIFLGFQGSYLFGAFMRKLPAGFTVAQYARQGFFELLGIMGLNFLLLWLVCYSSRTPVQKKKSSRRMCTLLLVESLLFALTAMSKLLLYIDCFGFTPLRLQSFWAVTVLMAGCICCGLSLWGKKHTFSIWVYFTGITLSLLCLY